jgi:phage protein U
MTLGSVVFHLDTAAYQKFQRRTEFRWESQQRLALPNIPTSGGPALEYISPGTDSINLDGVIYPDVMGDRNSVNIIRIAAYSGSPLPLIMFNGWTGYVLGLWIIESVEETHEAFAPGGAPRKIDFKLSLKFYGYHL